MSILEVKNITYYYQDGRNKRVILNDLDAEFEKCKFYAILGESGSGKTTFLSLISALDSPKEGTIL
ncbi:MAG: ATP-binding cassette domain-containing protein, partial [Erysipelotrichaceae bacterium]|nr:ATP-binding cassette domain-containing protein [Erysipelotrichaceae bacterium]